MSDVECPSCGRTAPYSAFAARGRCAGCETPVRTLHDMARRER